MTRRDKCSLVGRRGLKLAPREMAFAWAHFCGSLEAMEWKDVPKFRDLLRAARQATIYAKGTNKL